MNHTPNVHIRRLGMGGAFIGDADDEQCVAAVRRAIELGITYIDTSPMYRGGRSQAIVGRALRGIDAGGVTLATKIGYLPSPELFRSPEALRAQLAENLTRLGRQSVDVLQLHEADQAVWWGDEGSKLLRPEFIGDLRSAPAMQVLREARERGLCRRIGITGNNARPMTRLLRELDVDSFLMALSYDLLRSDACDEAIPLAKQKGVTLLIGGIFQCGRLAQVHPEWLDTPPKWMKPDLRDRYARLYAIQAECGLSLVELTIRFLLADERIDKILIGATTPAEVEQSVEAASRGPLPKGLHERALGLCG